MRITPSIVSLAAGVGSVLLLPPLLTPEFVSGSRAAQAGLRLDRRLTLPVGDAVFFGAASDADRWEDGRIAVLDGLAKAVYVFDAGGSVIDTIGREGAGPGEMRLAANLAIGPDGRLAVVDITNARITVWSNTGEYLQSVRVRPGWTGVRHLTWDAGGLTYKVSTFGSSTVQFYRVNLAADSLELLVGIPGEDVSHAGPTCTFCAHAVAPDTRLLVGAPDTLYRVTVLEPGGSIAQRYERTDLPAVRRSDAELEVLRDRLRRGPGRAEGAGRRPPEPDPYKPRMMGIALDGRGRLWVQLNPEEGAPGALDVFTADGAYRATVPVDPAERMLRIRGEWLLAAGENDIGEPILTIYRILG